METGFKSVAYAFQCHLLISFLLSPTPQKEKRKKERPIKYPPIEQVHAHVGQKLATDLSTKTNFRKISEKYIVKMINLTKYVHDLSFFFFITKENFS